MVSGLAWLKRPVFWIVLFAFVLRLGYVLSDAPTPVQFDARIYVSCALALSLAVTHPTILFDRETRASINYDLVYADLVKGESIEWLYYDPPSFDQALEWVYFAGPVYPALLGVVFLPDWGHDFAAARTVNVLLDVLSCALLYWILRRTAGRTTALIGAALFAIYPGAIIKCGELNLESLAAALVLVAVALCVSGILDKRPRRFFAAGLAAGLLLLTKASLSMLIIFLGAAVVLILWREWSGWLGAVRRLAAGFALLAVPWVLLIWIHYGAPSVRDPGYSAANFRSSNILPNRGYDLDFAREDFWTYPVGREILAHPGQYLALYAEKFYRLWNRPYNDYRVALVLGVDAQLWLHRLLVLGAAVGLFFWPTRESRYVALIAIAAVAYVSIVHTLWHSLTRYALPVIPLACGSASVGIVAIARRIFRRMPLSTWAVTGAAVFVTCLGWGWLSVGRVLAWSNSLSPEAASALVVVARSAILGGDLLLFSRLLGKSRRTWVMFGALLLGGQALLLVKSLPRERWAEWSTVLSSPTQIVERTIHFPPGYDWKKFPHVFLLADIQSGGGEQFVLNLQFDSTTCPLPGGEYSYYFYSKASYRPFLNAYRMKKEQVRQWVAFALEPGQVDTLMADGQVRVRLWVTGGDLAKNFVRVYGDYRSGGWRDWVGPTMTHPSVERLYEEGDPRIWERIPRELTGAENRWIDHGLVNSRDLSPAPGLQTGDYRLIIQGTTEAGQNVYF